MFLLVATALAGSITGWPCQRLNWGWRNVWSTCSIHSFAPQAGGAAETPVSVPTMFRFYTGTANPLNSIHPNGWFTPTASTLPTIFCTNAAATGTGVTANLRNRCRRAVDAYGALVRACQLPAGLAGNRGPVNGLAMPDWLPAAGHQPHVSNVQGLSHASAFCALPAGTTAVPASIGTPSTVCPGLLGWFTVVYNACGFTNSPQLSPSTLANTPAGVPNTPNIHNLFPLGGTTTSVVFTAPTGATNTIGSRLGIFCGTGSSNVPETWNTAGAAFRTSRCRKALDQFGRTAQRCAFSAAPVTGPAQAGGYSDPLRVLAMGTTTNGVPAAPGGINSWAPMCN